MRAGGRQHHAWVFSTPVEVFLGAPHRWWGGWRLLHARGGVSRSVGDIHAASSSSPRPWRCFPAYQQPHIMNLVFSTPVEVFLAEVVPTMALGRLLHARGGVSDQFVLNLGAVLSSPRPWRCFPVKLLSLCTAKVFSTPVEVFPSD